MSTLGCNKPRPGRIARGYLLAGGVCVAVANLYALFGHGVRSSSMDHMFLYPLLMGAAPFSLLAALPAWVGKRRLFRPASNLYSSGVAALTTGAMLEGILEIAGTASAYQPLFMAAGWLLAGAGALLLLAPSPRGDSG